MAQGPGGGAQTQAWEVSWLLSVEEDMGHLPRDRAGGREGVQTERWPSQPCLGAADAEEGEQEATGGDTPRLVERGA